MRKTDELLKELERLDNEGVLIVLAMPNIYQKVNLKILSFLVNEKGHECVYIALNRPHNKIVKTLEKNKISPSKFFFIDTIYETVYGQPPEAENVLFVSSPHGLTEMSISLNKAMNSLSGKKKFIFLDSISTLLVYNEPLSVTKFAHFLVGRTLASGMKGVFMSLQKESERATINQIAQFVDSVVIARG